MYITIPTYMYITIHICEFIYMYNYTNERERDLL